MDGRLSASSCLSHAGKGVQQLGGVCSRAGLPPSTQLFSDIAMWASKKLLTAHVPWRVCKLRRREQGGNQAAMLWQWASGI